MSEVDTLRLNGFEDPNEYDLLLRRELALIRKWFDEGVFSNYPNQIGYEIEWIMLDEQFHPLQKSLEFIDRYHSPNLTTEANRAQLEFSTDHFRLNKQVFTETKQHFQDLLNSILPHENEFGYKMYLIGTYPMKYDEIGTKEQLTQKRRYQTLDESLHKFRGGNNVHLQFSTLNEQFESLSLNGLCSSFHIHLRVRQEEATSFYNAAQMIAGPVLAACTNSPFFFDQQLWEESRIAIFEQGVHVPSQSDTFSLFGHQYVKESLDEIFEENFKEFPHLLPFAKPDEPIEHLLHFRVMNSISYRWNRPRIDFDAYGTPHLRIEYRALPIGPTIADMVANAALLMGAIVEFGQNPPPIPFEIARENFYTAAKTGIDSVLHFPKEIPVQTLLLETVIPAARSGLERLKIAKKDIDENLKIIEDRVQKKQTGSVWQRKILENNGGNFSQMLSEYHHFQQLGNPVHTWGLNV